MSSEGLARFVSSPGEQVDDLQPKAIGIFGGTFDPIHNAHLHIARAAREQAQLDKVLFVVAARPPHKQGGACASAEDRYSMVCRALESEEGLEPCRIELDRSGPSYTVDTVRWLMALYPEAKLFLIIGCDSLREFLTWRDPTGILECVNVLVVPRPNQTADIPAELEGHYRFLDFEPMALSSTGIRQRLLGKKDIDGLAPAAVTRMIKKEDCYRE